MNEATLSVPEIHCNHCKNAIEGAVGALEGVASAEVSVADATVTVGFGDPASVEGIIGAIEDQGYEVPAQ